MMLDQLAEKCREAGLHVSDKEFLELGIFSMFLSAHVKPNKGISLSCMSLWAEWVRFFLKTMNEFPDLICEEEFRNLVVRRFECGVSEDEYGGYVYPGIEFIPERNVSVHMIDTTFARA